MRLTIRLILILMMMFATAGAAVAQETPVEPDTSAETTAVTEETIAEPLDEAEAIVETPSSYELRNQFGSLIREHPSELRTILALEPTLLSNEEFLAGYPQLAAYVAEHPEVAASPRFYLAQFQAHRDRGMIGEVVESIAIFATILLIALALAWLVRTIIEQKRWNRLSRTQSEVHNKILDRFGTTAELLEYVRTPAGARFLESAPIPLHAEQAPQNPSLTRVLWSIQIGVVVAAAAVGMLLVSLRLEENAAEELFTLGVIGFFVGAGFVGSAAISMMLSRRLGLWESGTADRLGVRES